MSAELIYNFLGILLMLMMSALFSASETSLTSVSRARIYHLRNEGNKRAKLVYKLREQNDALIGSILIGNNIINIFASALATGLALNAWGEHGILYVTGIMSVLIIVFAEILPKTIALEHSERIALWLSPFIAVMVWLCRPLNWFIQHITGAILRILGSRATPHLVSAADALRGSIALHHDQGEMVKQDKDMLSSVLDLDEVPLEDIMTHRKLVQTIDADLSAAEIIEAAVNTPHTRLPLWKETPDNIIGVLHIKTLMRALREHGQDLSKDILLGLLTTPWFIPSTTSLKEQLQAFRTRRQHLAFVIDEYGMWLGIVTLEDILEEIVGAIDDEHDYVDNKNIVRITADSWMIQGSVTVRELNRALDIRLSDEEASTVAGYVIHLARKIPHKNEVFKEEHLQWTVMERTDNQITRVKLTRLNAPENS